MKNHAEADKISMKLLMQLEEELSNRLENLTLDLSKSHSRDSGEQAVERENDEVISTLESETKDELQQVKNAIKRIQGIKQGNYHICTECEEEIPAERLSAIPYTTLCLKCAESKEEE